MDLQRQRNGLLHTRLISSASDLGPFGLASLEGALDAFLLDKRRENRSARTLEFYALWLGPLVAGLRQRGLTEPRGLTAPDIKTYLESIRARSTPRGAVSSLTVHAAARAIRAFCRWLYREEYLDKNPFDRIRMPKATRPLPPSLSHEDLTRLVRAAAGQHETPRRDTALVLLLLSTGVRASEILALRLSDTEGRLGPSFRLRVRGKGAQERWATPGREAQAALHAYLAKERPRCAEDDHIFLGRAAMPLRYDGLRAVFTRLSRASGVKATPHMLRHTFALATLASREWSLAELQRALGHASPAMTMWYAQARSDDLAAAHKRYDPADAWRHPRG